MSPSRKNPIPDQDINRLSTPKYQSIPPQLDKYPPGYKSLINEAEDGSNDFINTSLTNKLIFCKQCLTKGYSIITNNSKQ